MLTELGKQGDRQKRITGTDPVSSAITFARYADGAFGWNVTDPGPRSRLRLHPPPAGRGRGGGAVSTSGTYGPLLLVTDAGVLPAPLQDYLLDIQPGYTKDPVRGVYNHGWVIGDESAIAAAVQARMDTLLEIQPVDSGG